jgi:hypothetical protein
MNGALFQPLYAFMAWWLIKHGGNFRFTFVVMGFSILKSGCLEVVRHIKSSEELACHSAALCPGLNICIIGRKVCISTRIWNLLFCLPLYFNAISCV